MAKYYRRYGKKTSRAGKRRTKRRTTTKISKNLISDSTQVMLKYVTQFTLDPATGAVAKKTISANVANNPEDASGHQPMGWDQWGQFYDKYVVLGSKCSVIFHTTTSTNAGQNIVAIRTRPALGTVTITGITDLLEQRGATYKPITNITAQGHARLSKTFSAKKVIGKNLDDAYGKVNTTSLTETLADQTNLIHYEVMLVPATSTQDPVAVFCTATISYIVKFLEPKQVASS